MCAQRTTLPGVPLRKLQYCLSEFLLPCSRHYPAHALRRANKALLLGRNGKSLFGSTQDVVTEQNISDYFGVRAVIGSIETPDGAYADVIPVSAAQSEEAP